MVILIVTFGKSDLRESSHFVRRDSPKARGRPLLESRDDYSSPDSRDDYSSQRGHVNGVTSINQLMIIDLTTLANSNHIETDILNIIPLGYLRTSDGL